MPRPPADYTNCPRSRSAGRKRRKEPRLYRTSQSRRRTSGTVPASPPACSPSAASAPAPPPRGGAQAPRRVPSGRRSSPARSLPARRYSLRAQRPRRPALRQRQRFAHPIPPRHPRSLPLKNSATVPGPEWLPMTGPTALRMIRSGSHPNSFTSVSFTTIASFSQSPWLMKII